MDKENTLLPQIDDVFPFVFNTIYFDCNLEIEDYDSIVEQFENLAEKENGRIEDDDRVLMITYHTIDGLEFKLNFNLKKCRIYTDRNYSLMTFISKSENLLKTLTTKVENKTSV